jgi:cysteine desulfurase / selenocysteine lyase
MSTLDQAAVRAQFPGLGCTVNGKPLVYLDSANTAQKFGAAIDASSRYYLEFCANVFRAVHTLGEQATREFELTRDAVRTLINAPERAEVIFTSGTTAAINLVAHSFGQQFLAAGDEILLTELEHHANIVPWQLLASRLGLHIRVVPIDATGALDMAQAERLLSGRVKLFAFTHVSNALGTITPVAQLCTMAKARGITTLIDGSQALPHIAVDVQALGCDFYVFTGHKLFAPTGTGVLWGKRALLEAMPPFLGGGEMIERVSFSGTTFNAIPNKFEAGTPNIAGFVGLGAAITALGALDASKIRAHEQAIGAHAMQALSSVAGLTLLGPMQDRVPVFSFTVAGAHAHDLAMLLDQDGIAIRSGQHCAHPLMQKLGVSATARASLAFYNTTAEIDVLVASLRRAIKLLA